MLLRFQGAVWVHYHCQDSYLHKTYKTCPGVNFATGRSGQDTEQVDFTSDNYNGGALNNAWADWIFDDLSE